MNNKGKGLIKLIAAVLIIGVFSYLCSTVIRDSNAALNSSGEQSEEASKNTVKLGLDLAGGVSITYQTTDPDPSDTDISDTIYKLQKRVQNYSTEAEVYREGSNRINIDIPGVSDANAILDALGKPGSLEFRDPSGELVFDGTHVASAQAAMYKDSTTGATSYAVSLTFDDEATKTFGEVTSANIGNVIYIIYDGETVSAPVVQEAITGGQCQITGLTSYEEAETLASTIRIGSLKLELEELRSNVVGAKLGQEALASALKAGAIGFVMLALLMIVVFRIPGLAAVMALVLYVALEILLLAAFNENITLTLPGIAGIVLSIGMAVDANVIIFTQIKEGLGVGKTVRSAVKAGFKRALSAIIDGNITTLIAAVVLMVKGSGTVVGFAQTLALGIVLSMFTALFVTRFILMAFIDCGCDDPKFFGVIKPRKSIDFLGKRRIFISISLACIAAGFIFMGIHASSTGDILNYGIDIKGGTSTDVTFNEPMSLERVDNEVKPVVAEVIGGSTADIQAQTVANSNEVILKTRNLNADEREALHNALVEKFGVDDNLITEENISGAISSEMKSDALMAVILSLIFMLAYIWIRFKDFAFAASSVTCLIHDVLVVLAFYSIVSWTVGSTFIACMLTLIGYSINATIVVFDRIREQLALDPNADKKEIANSSITHTLSRSVYSSLTTFIMVAVLYVLSVASIKEFALPIMVGILCGTYSSVCLAGALWYMLNKKFGNKKKAETVEAAKVKK
jgi:SecD/SecF fusion protein